MRDAMQLSPSALASALAYNAGRTFDESDLKALALLTPDALNKRVALDAIAAFQAAHGLTPDGKIGPKTLAKARALSASLSAPSRPEPVVADRITRVGAWAMRGALLSPADDLALAKAVGLTDVSFSVHEAGGFDPFVSAAAFADIAKRYADAGIRPHAMFWPEPVLRHASLSLNYLQDIIEAGGPLASADLDAEGPWVKSAKLASAGKAVADYYREHWPETLPLVVNGITAALPSLAELLRIADVVIPQAYTERDQPTIPGERQTHVIAKWRKAAPHAQLVCGLAAYRQDGAGGLAAPVAMQRAWGAVEAAGVAEVRYWSLHDLAKGAARDFVSAKCKGLRP